MNKGSTTAVTDIPSSGRLIATLAIIAMLSGFLVVLVYQVTLERITRNHQEYLERAVFNVLPGATQRVNFRLAADGLKRLPDESVGEANVFAGYDDAGNLVGVAMQASARGYADVIRVLYGYAPDRECIIGFTVLESSETPGLGDKIETDPAFLANFDCLDVRLNPEGSELENEIVTVKQGKKSEDWQIDGITGATVTSVAVGRALRESTREMIPALAPHLDKLTIPSPASKETAIGESGDTDTGSESPTNREESE